MKGIRRHLYWSATSTKPGFGNLILAKWNSFLRHVANKHTNHPDPLYKECNHAELQPRKWIKIGECFFVVVVYITIAAQFMETRVLRKVRKYCTSSVKKILV